VSEAKAGSARALARRGRAGGGPREPRREHATGKNKATVERTFNVLFLCTGNSARSIMAECALNRWGKGRFRGFSAGSHPRGQVHPMTFALLAELGYETAGLHSKSWEEFARPGAPAIDFVLTVCDQAAAEPCPLWPGGPIAAHWGVPDPAAFAGDEQEQRRLFQAVYLKLENRVKRLASLPMDSLGPDELKRRLREIGDDASGQSGA
jgi:protein-tyrosine-phosphatase